jgi:hypothetical protein
MQLITAVHPETHEILENARKAKEAGEITQQDYNDIVLSCFQAEESWQLADKYPETAPAEVTK